MSSDPINPAHYKHLPVEAIGIIEAAIAKAPSNESAYLHGQVLKYLLRCWEKKGIEDLRKAKWYLDRMVNSFDDLLAEASGANETPIDETTAEPPKGWRWIEVGENFRVEDTLNTIGRIPENWIGTACVVKHCAFRKIELPSREEFLNEIDGVWNEGSSNDTDQDDHPHDFKVGDAVISWQGREGVIEAVNLIDDFPITVRHSIREQVSYKLGGVKKKHDDHPVEAAPWTPKIGERVIYTPSGSVWTVTDEEKESPRDGVTYVLKMRTFTLRASVDKLKPYLKSKPKRYRESTLEDLRNGPIQCEVGDSHEKRTLIYVFPYGPGRARFAAVDEANPNCVGRWIDCRIEVT